VIPWEFQYINTYSDLFIWSKSAPEIKITTAGYYLLEVCVWPYQFDQKITVKVLVNEAVVYQTVAVRKKKVNFFSANFDCELGRCQVRRESERR
jgi:hypothetical protein